MLKTLLASAFAGTLALTSVATPAMADRAETVRTIVGIAALAAIASAIANDHRKSRPVEVTRPHWPDDRRDWRHDRDRYRHRTWLPSACAYELPMRGSDRAVTVVGKQCLRDHRVDARRLPSACQFDIRTRSGSREVYGARCLEGYGYRVAARR